VGREAYAAEIAKVHQARPGIRDDSLEEERAWFRFAFKWLDPEKREPLSRAGLQLYRIEAGQLAETWVVLQPLGSSWPDTIDQEYWTSPPPGRDSI
jgi:hypothetical protein